MLRNRPLAWKCCKCTVWNKKELNICQLSILYLEHLHRLAGNLQWEQHLSLVTKMWKVAVVLRKQTAYVLASTKFFCGIITVLYLAQSSIKDEYPVSFLEPRMEHKKIMNKREALEQRLERGKRCCIPWHVSITGLVRKIALQGVYCKRYGVALWTSPL